MNSNEIVQRAFGLAGVTLWSWKTQKNGTVLVVVDDWAADLARQVALQIKQDNHIDVVVDE